MMPKHGSGCLAGAQDVPRPRSWVPWPGMTSCRGNLNWSQVSFTREHDVISKVVHRLVCIGAEVDGGKPEKTAQVLADGSMHHITIVRLSAPSSLLGDAEQQQVSHDCRLARVMWWRLALGGT